MNILFISYAEVSLKSGSIRTVAMLRALADAGHRVDLVAPLIDLPEHAGVHIFSGTPEKPMRRHHVRLECMAAFGRVSYDAMHAVDEAVFFAQRLCRWKKIPLVYDAARRFTGTSAGPVSNLWKWFPTWFQRLEAQSLNRASVVLSPCSALSADLRSMNQQVLIEQIPDIPAQSLHALQQSESSAVLRCCGTRPEAVVVGHLSPVNSAGIRLMLMAARKVIDSAPDTAFFFNGVPPEQAEEMAANLNIASRCIFLEEDQQKLYLEILQEADALLLIAQGQGRYIDPVVYTLLQSGVPLVAVHDHAYDEVLTEKNTVRVLLGVENIAEGVLRAVREPLFSKPCALEAQQLVADHYTYSSFKHKVRMAYKNLKRRK